MRKIFEDIGAYLPGLGLLAGVGLYHAIRPFEKEVSFSVPATEPAGYQTTEYSAPADRYSFESPTGTQSFLLRSPILDESGKPKLVDTQKTFVGRGHPVVTGTEYIPISREIKAGSGHKTEYYRCRIIHSLNPTWTRDQIYTHPTKPWLQLIRTADHVGAKTFAEDSWKNRIGARRARLGEKEEEEDVFFVRYFPDKTNEFTGSFAMVPVVEWQTSIDVETFAYWGALLGAIAMLPPLYMRIADSVRAGKLIELHTSSSPPASNVEKVNTQPPRSVDPPSGEHDDRPLL